MKTLDPKDRNEVEVFLPATNEEDSAEHEEFMTSAAELAQEGYPIRVYLRGEDDWAFEQCDPVREILEINGDDALPITLLGANIMGMYAFPDAAKLKRLSETPATTPKEATNSCTPGSGNPPAGIPRKDSPIKGLFGGQSAMLTTPEPRGPEMGDRWNLMGGKETEGPAVSTTDNR